MIYPAIFMLFGCFHILKSENLPGCSIIDQFCYCDKECLFYNDCCPGNQYYNVPKSKNSNFYCKRTGSIFPEFVLTVDSCLETNDPLQVLCSNLKYDETYPILNYIPVIVKSNQLVYQNAFCAQCNGFNNFKYIDISISESFLGLPVENITEANEKLKTDKISYKISPNYKSSTFRNCHEKLIRTCENRDDELSNNCTFNSLNIQYNGSYYFRNEFCCQCGNSACMKLFRTAIPFSNSFSYILNFNEWKDKNMKNPSNLITNQSNVFDGKLNDSMTNSTTGEKENLVIYYISYSFIVVSILALIFLILLYLLNKSFHNFGGYLTITLCGCLLIVNIFLLLTRLQAIVDSGFCRYAAIIQHFFLISNFLWMALYALDLFQTFASNRARGKKKTVKTFMLYCSVGFGSVSLWIIAAVLVDSFVDVDADWIPGYGGENCFFTNKLGGIIWYFIPVCCLLAWNSAACIVVFYKLHKTSQECRMVKKRESNTTIWICLRLTAVFGLGYIIQIIAIATQVFLVIQLGAMFNCLQGFFLAACFFWAKRVRTAVRTSLYSFGRSFGTSTSTTNTNTKDANKTVGTTDTTALPQDVQKL